ncbi:carbamoyl phosphate synthase small subunit [Streptomyces sp. NRRL F-4489]|uniref:glutamine-hydrolyzing carbamoyl-phosphate synthase small subunit n=1 Tax=Streptomyces sp. NRRL F-4489 TaxID=1609095 RepID=UPI0007466825|nr:glutamine-hydrolyzing carbamoyl-phosphate synthase small subunit [Streptomyces sp. NRRL F-4489]KUL53513.1 carbamoyl phosphate synthase small subunit [Streptomyces sp. NRRL F-4489]
MAQHSAMLVLEDGSQFPGLAYGATGRSLGEMVFCTSMTGYQETLTDPSYHRQIVMQTAPQIGNTGWNDEDDESDRIWAAGYVVRDPALHPSHWQARRSLGEELYRQGIVGIAGVDTRTLARHLREHGTMRGGIFSVPTLPDSTTMLTAVRASRPMKGAALAHEVGVEHRRVIPAVGSARFRIAALDTGIKDNIHRLLSERGVETHLLPPTSTFEDVQALDPDGLFLPNGPGDPATAGPLIQVVTQALHGRLPVFGICLGNQILGQALGLRTYKLRYGHRGTNVPVIDARTGRVAITAQNHGFALDAGPGRTFTTPFGTALVSHYCPNDGTVEGLRCLEAPAFSVQYHPEAAAGPHDARPLFDEFVTLMEKGREA